MSVSWANVKKFLRELFYDSPTKIIVCDNRVTIPEPPETDKILTENHASLVIRALQKHIKESATIMFGQV